MTFHDCTRGELMSGSIDAERADRREHRIGAGDDRMRIAADVRYGSSKRPAGSLMSERLPNGGAAARLLKVLAAREVVDQRVRRAHREAAVAVHVPRRRRRAARSSTTACSARTCPSGKPGRPDR